MLSMHESRAYVEEVLRAGASGYVVKNSASKDVHNAIDAVIDFEQRVVTDADAFEPLHVRYKQVAAAQWLAAVVHLTVMLTTNRTERQADHDGQ